MSAPDPSYPVLGPLLGRAQPAPSAPPPWSGLHPAANVHKIMRAGTVAILLVFGTFGLWATLAPLSGAIIGMGLIKVDLNRKTVQHLEGGIVKEILVRDGDRVQAGQALIVIEDERVDASVDVVQGLLDAEMAKTARLAAERDSLEQIVFPDVLLERADDPEVSELIRTETNFFETRRGAMRQQIKLLEQQIEEARHEIKSLDMRAQAEMEASRLLEEEVAANETLGAKQYVQKTQILTLKRGIEDYKARRGEHLADIARAGQKITDLELRIATTRDTYLQQATEGLTAAQAKIFDLQERLRPSQDMQRRQHITAPIAGTVVGLKVFTVGGIIGPREPLMDIVPDANELIVEAQIGVDDIDDVHVGQEADVRLSAYKRRTTPLVIGEVSYVAADRMTSQDGTHSYYITRITVTREALAEAGDIALYPGMPAEVFIRTAERTALDYLLAPVTNVLRRSFREP